MNKNSENVLRKSMISPSESTRFWNPRIFLWAVLIAGILFAARYFGSGSLRELLQWISGLGSTAPLVFIPLYVVACVLFIPGSILTLSAGFLFGVVRGSMYVSVAATVGATLAFLMAGTSPANGSRRGWPITRSSGQWTRPSPAKDGKSWRLHGSPQCFLSTY